MKKGFIGALLLVPFFMMPSTAWASSGSVSVSPSDFGVNTFSWDSQIQQAGAQTDLSQLGIGMQQYPNSVRWSWKTNTDYSTGTPSKAPTSLSAWTNSLKAANQTGLFIFNYCTFRNC